MGKKNSTTAVSKISSTSSLAVSSATTTAQKSSILKSKFAPSALQLHLFASVIQSFESQQLRIHDTNTGRLRCEHAARPGTNVTCLEWGYYGTSYRKNRQGGSGKKRKRDHNQQEDVVLAYGTSNSEICMFSPAEGKIVGKLGGIHDRGIKDFKFSAEDHLEAWSLGGDGKLVQWDLNNDQAIRTIALPDPSINTLASPTHTTPQILCASATPYSIDFSSSEDFRIESFDSFKNPVHSLFRSGTDGVGIQETFLAVDNDRYINIYDFAQKKLSRSLIAGSEVVAGDLYAPASKSGNALNEQVLAVVTRDGTVELFLRPFMQPKQINGGITSSRKNLTMKASARVKLVSPPGSRTKSVPIFAASLQGPELLIVSAEGGVDVSFQKIRWQDEDNGELLFDGTKEIVRSRGASSLKTAQMNGIKDMGKTHVDESRTVVVNGGSEGSSQGAAIEIVSSDDENEEEVEAESSEQDEAEDQEGGSDESDAEMEDAEGAPLDVEDEDMVDAAQSPTEPEEPSFGDMLAAKHPGTISIVDALQPESTALVAPTDGRPIAIPSGMSLGTVLSQALRTNDHNLLESCLHTSDTDIVRNTIQRLDSLLAANLLSKLAERLASRPGRYGHLITWVQWICVAHGGAIAGRADVAAKLRSLHGVLSQRAESLQNLQLLKGKLDMLDLQLAYRKQLQAQRSAQKANQDEPGMIYIEGEPDNFDSDDDLDEDAGPPTSRKRSKHHARRDLTDIVLEDESSSDEEMRLVNGVSHEARSESDEEASDEETNTITQRAGTLYDEEAEESDASGPADDLDESDDEEEEEDEEDSELDSFINDGTLSEVEDEDDVGVDIGNGVKDVDDEVKVELLKSKKTKTKHR